MRAVRTATLWTARLTGALAALLLLGASAREAAAQGLDLPIPGIGPPPLTGDIEQVEKRAFWKAGRQRWFFSTVGEVGNLYLRTAGAVGYGKPHWSWVGIEGSTSLSPSGGSAYGGLRLSTPYVDLRVGSRYVFTASHHFLRPRVSFDHDAALETFGSKSRYVLFEAEAAAGYALPQGSLFGVAGIYGIVGPPEGWYLLEQSLQVIAEPPVIWRARLGYLVPVDRWDSFRLGAAVEVIGNPSRGALVVRAGPAITAMITHHLEAFGAALVVVSSPDKIGLMGDQLGEVGFRYRWSTGDRWPEFP